jgi:hypothetical protein
MSKGFKWSVLLLLLGLLCLMFWPFVPMMCPTWNCTKNEINIKTGQGRDSRYIAFIKTSEKVYDTALSTAITGTVDVVDIPAWHPVNTFSPPSHHVSPHYYFHGALHQAHWAEGLFEALKATPEQKEKLARQILIAWQTNGDDRAAGEMIWHMLGETLRQKESKPDGT